VRRLVFVIAGALAAWGICACGGGDQSNQPAPDGGSGLDGSSSGSDAGVDSAQPATDGPAQDSTTPTDAGGDAVVPGDTGADAGADGGADTGPDSGSCIVDISGDYYLRSDGTVVYYSVPTAQQVVMNGATGMPLKTVTQVSAQFDHACALLSDMTVWCWPVATGHGNDNGGLGNGVTGGNQAAFTASQVVTQAAPSSAYLTNVIALESQSAAYYEHPTCGIRNDKTLWCWGVSDANGGAPTGVYWGTTASTAAVPYAFPLASGPSPDGGPAPLIHADAVTVGGIFLCYLSSGKVSCLGMGTAGNLGDRTQGVFEPYPVGVKQANGLPATVDAIASGYFGTCARAGGGVWCWGDDTYGEIGNPGAPQDGCGIQCRWQPTPVQVAAADGGLTSFPDAGENQSPLTGVTEVVGGYFDWCAVDTGGVLRCWGGQNGGSVVEATPYNAGTAPSAHVVKVAVSAEQEDISNGVRYLTSDGVLVQKQQVVTPMCP
jgi:hypothetical protein